MDSIRTELVRYGIKIVQARLVAGAGGNISARDGDIIWMKPSGLALDEMTAADLCGMDLKTGRQIKGKRKPTSEVNMHLAVYRARPDVKAIFHTHSPWASGVITSGIVLRPMFAEFVNDLGRTGTVPYVTPTTQRLADAMGKKARTCDTIFMVNHGVLAVGANQKQAYFRVVVVEDAAKSLVAACVVGRPRFLTQRQAREILSLPAVKHRTKMAEAGG
ncbi:MAG: class II aldolase/adducin family protein [Verrucomicrobia bacterium]|nr:class II aldolase/adducin family protein [Verrucomicrobiota bacterium]